uniref:Uncharacterized protein n=1 Tax=Mustela putorius furo TaxID=9669 RepID=M3Y7J4_MUSPF
ARLPPPAAGAPSPPAGPASGRGRLPAPLFFGGENAARGWRRGGGRAVVARPGFVSSPPPPPRAQSKEREPGVRAGHGILLIYSMKRKRHSERGNTSRERGRSRLPAQQGTRCLWIPGPWIMTCPKGRCLTIEPPRLPHEK